METFKTLLINSSNRMQNIYERDGLLTVIGAGERQTIEADATGLYAQYESVEWHVDGVVLKPRADWIDQRPEGTVRVILTNMGPNTVERRDLPGFGTVHLGRNVPVAIDVPLGHPLAIYQALEIKLVEAWAEISSFKGYLKKRTTKEDLWILRPAGEFDKIKKAALKEIEAEEIHNENA